MSQSHSYHPQPKVVYRIQSPELMTQFRSCHFIFIRFQSLFFSCFGLRELVSYQDKFGGLSCSSAEFTSFCLCTLTLLVDTTKEEHICRPQNLSHFYFYVDFEPNFVHRYNNHITFNLYFHNSYGLTCNTLHHPVIFLYQMFTK